MERLRLPWAPAHPHAASRPARGAESRSAARLRAVEPLLPSLASIIAGRYAHQHGITSNVPALPPTVKGRDRAQRPFFPEGRRLGERGYLAQYSRVVRLVLPLPGR